MSQTLWAMRKQAKKNSESGIHRTIGWTTALKLAEQVAREMVIHVEDRMRVHEGRRMLCAVVAFSVAAFAAGFMLARKLLL